MKYLITGFDIAKGTPNDDVTPDRPYFELGWEVVTTHFDAKHLVAMNAAHDTIAVTCSGREFLYETTFSEVIDYATYCERRRSRDEAVDLTRRYAEGRIPSEFFDEKRQSPTALYRYLRADAHLIRDILLEPTQALHRGEPYCCFAIRRRAHDSYRNIDESTTHSIIIALAKRYRNIFTVGNGIDECSGVRGVCHVSLKKFASLIADPLCGIVVGSFSGPMQLAGIISQARICVVLNYDRIDVVRQNHPVHLGACVRLSRSRFLFVSPSAVPKLLQIGF